MERHVQYRVRCFDGCVTNSFQSWTRVKLPVEYCAGRYIKMTQRVDSRFAEHRRQQNGPKRLRVVQLVVVQQLAT
jgi:hypothetical protein